jgi:hypothetical protein
MIRSSRVVLCIVESVIKKSTKAVGKPEAIREQVVFQERAYASLVCAVPVEENIVVIEMSEKGCP